MDRKKPPNRRLVSLRAVSTNKAGDPTSADGPQQEIIAIALGYRMVHAQDSEIWTVTGLLRDGMPTRQDIGELSFTVIPGDTEPATAVVGFLAPQAPYFLGVTEDAMWQQLRGIVTQLGYDIDGFYASLSVGGTQKYFEDYKR
jgi:hypothetical protein